MTRLLHISDPHFGTEQPAVVEALLAFAHQQQPNHILLSGDISQRARRRQFNAAANFVRALPAPVLAVPGNHDIPLFNLLARCCWPYANYRRALGHNLEPEFENEDLLLIGVNSCRPRRHIDGEVSEVQIARVTRRLAQARPQQLRVVIQHHPVRAMEDTDLSNLLIGRQQAVPHWVDAGMDILVAGHIHLPYAHSLSGHSQRRAWTVQAGTALSHRLRDSVPNSINMICYQRHTDSRQCLLQRWDYAAEPARFEQVAERLLPLAP